MRIGSFEINPLSTMLVFIPICAILEITHADPPYVFITAGLAIIPLAGMMGTATEHLAERRGAGIGGLLNATFGNAAEFIIGLVALKAGLLGVVKASITGSIIGNILLVLGASCVAGGLKFETQRFNRTAASVSATLLALATVGLIIPSVFHNVVASQTATPVEQELSLEIAIVLFACYILGLIFSLRTHSHLYAGKRSEVAMHVEHSRTWTQKKSLTVLLFATALVAVMSEFLVNAVEHTAKTWGFSEVFIGVILVAIVGNAAEHSTAVIMAMKNQMDLAINIAIGSSIQIALFIAPLLVFCGYLFGQPMNLLFTTFEVLSIAISAWIVVMIASDGESNWIEGILLLAVYLILGIAFFYLPA